MAAEDREGRGAVGVTVGTRAIAILAIRNVVRNLRTPLLVGASLLQPIIWLVFFSQTFDRLADTPQLASLGVHSYLSYFAPGMVVLSVLFTALTSAMATISDIDSGVLDRFLTSPIRRSSILLGRVAADAITMIAQGALVLGVAVLMGARIQTGLAGALGILALATALGIVWASLANLIALRTRSSELTMVGGLFLTLPAVFLSSAFFPRPYLPAWLQALADWNPAAYVITTGQQLMNTGNDWGQDLRTLSVLGVASVILMPATVAAFRAATR